MNTFLRLYNFSNTFVPIISSRVHRGHKISRIRIYSQPLIFSPISNILDILFVRIGVIFKIARPKITALNPLVFQRRRNFSVFYSSNFRSTVSKNKNLISFRYVLNFFLRCIKLVFSVKWEDNNLSIWIIFFVIRLKIISFGNKCLISARLSRL